MTVAQWLDTLGQPAAARACFWTPLVLAVCNETPERAASAPFLAVLREAVASRTAPAGLAFPRRPLSDLLVAPALTYLRARGAIIREATAVEAIVRDGAHAHGVRLRGGETVAAEAVVSAVPPRALHRLIAAGGAVPAGWEPLADWPGVPICSVHLWFDRPVMDGPMVGLIGSRFHWAFEKANGSGLALVISAAREEATWPRERIVAEAVAAVHRYLPAARAAQLLHTQVTKEPGATMSLTPDTAPWRLPTITPWRTLFLAGDWTATGLPATIEGAVRSGHAAARAALRSMA